MHVHDLQERGGGHFLKGLSNLQLCSWDHYSWYEKKLRESLVFRNVLSLQPLNFLQDTRLQQRVTYICWHRTLPYSYAVGSKHGDIVVGTVEKNSAENWKGILKGQINGPGPGGSITAMQFDDQQPHIIYRTSVDSSVKRVDMSSRASSVYADNNDPLQWFTSMDIDYKRRSLFAGDNKGTVQIFELDSQKRIGSYRLHKSKIHHLEFHKRDPNLLVSAGIPNGNENAAVKLWDIRKLNLNSPLQVLSHNSGVNVARFNPLDGSKLLTSDQMDEIRIYPFNASNLFGKPLIIKHHHKQFQHITPVKASWHPLADVIVIGKYPKNQGEKPQRYIEFYSDSGKLLGEVRPPANLIVSLNEFNANGELMLSGMSSEFVLWKNATNFHEIGNQDPNTHKINDAIPISQEMKSQLRGRNSVDTTSTARRRRREFSPVSDDDENDANKKKKPRKIPMKMKK